MKRKTAAMIKWWWKLFACQIKELWEPSSLIFPTHQTCLWTAETSPIRQNSVCECKWMCIQTRWSVSQHNVARCREPLSRGHRSGTGQASKSSLWGRIIRHIHSDTFLSLRAKDTPEIVSESVSTFDTRILTDVSLMWSMAPADPNPHAGYFVLHRLPPPSSRLPAVWQRERRGSLSCEWKLHLMQR